MLGRLLKGLFAGKGGASDERERATSPAMCDRSAQLNDEGVRFYGEGRLQEAAQAFQRAIKADASNADALGNLGIVLARGGKTSRALEFFGHSLNIRPGHTGTLANYAFALREAGRHDEAVDALNQVIHAEPQNLERWCDLALVHKEIGELDAAQRCSERVLALDGAYARAHALLGAVAIDAGRFGDAEASLRRADATPEGAAQAAPYWAFLRLGRHEFTQGWEYYQSRKRIADESPLRPYPFPEWRGESLAGKRLLIYAEQGLGDEIMFASCMPDAAAQAEQVILECDPRLAGLFSRSFPDNVRVVPFQRRGKTVLPLAELGSLDFQVPAGDLPRHFRRALADFPGLPFLRPDPMRVTDWRRRLDSMGAGPKVGIAWRGGLGKTRSRARSLSVDELEPLLRLPGIHWFSLQFRPTLDDQERLRRVMRMGDEFPGFDAADYSELAAFVSALDRVVSVCGSTVHFAGALGIPTWVLAPFVPEWRYGLAGETMPWYASVRLFRQDRPGNWAGILARATVHLT